jgi:DNA anti-recombination protein RmuC
MGQLGKQLDTVQKTYLDVEGTRSRQLTKVVDQIASHSHAEDNPAKKLAKKNK